jgi:chromosome segregation ATPase
MTLVTSARSYHGDMGSWLNERRLAQTASRLRTLRDELAMIDEQVAHFADDAEELALRALVSETPGASYESNAARQHLEAMQRHRQHVIEEIAGLELRQDRLLDQMHP